MQGICIGFDRKKRWGFIEGADGKNYFFHDDDVLLEEGKVLRKGNHVEFDLRASCKSCPKAFDIRMLPKNKK